MKKLLAITLILLLSASVVYAENQVPQVKIAYDASDNPIYIGKAPANTLTSSAFWQIKKITYSGSNATDIQFADGNSKWDNIWDNRASLTYS